MLALNDTAIAIKSLPPAPIQPAPNAVCVIKPARCCPKYTLPPANTCADLPVGQRRTESKCDAQYIAKYYSCEGMFGWRRAGPEYYSRCPTSASLYAKQEAGIPGFCETSGNRIWS